MSRGFLLGFIALGGALAVLFAVFPLWDLEVAQVFFDRERARFPLSVAYEWNLVRQAANWVPFLLLAPTVFALLRKPRTRKCRSPRRSCFISSARF